MAKLLLLLLLLLSLNFTQKSVKQRIELAAH